MKSLSVRVRVILVVIGFAFSSYAEVGGGNWKYIGEAYEGIYFYDGARITRPSEDTARVWIRILYTQEGINRMVSLLGRKYETLSYAIALFQYQCRDKKKQIVPIAFYSKDGKVLISADDRIFNWNFMSPDSVDEALYKILCK